MYLIPPFFHWNIKILGEQIKKLESKKFVKLRFLITFAFQVSLWSVIVKLMGSKKVYWELLTKKSKPVLCVDS